MLVSSSGQSHSQQTEVLTQKGKINRHGLLPVRFNMFHTRTHTTVNNADANGFFLFQAAR